MSWTARGEGGEVVCVSHAGQCALHCTHLHVRGPVSHHDDRRVAAGRVTCVERVRPVRGDGGLGVYHPVPPRIYMPLSPMLRLEPPHNLRLAAVPRRGRGGVEPSVRAVAAIVRAD